MPDSFTGTTTQCFLSRLTGLFAGLLGGSLLVIAAIVLRSWNEGRAVNMLADERSSESRLTWILRAVGAMGMFIGFTVFLSPLSTLASVVPFLGSLIGGAAALLAWVISIPLTLVMIALAWLTVRPLIGIALLAGSRGSVRTGTHAPQTRDRGGAGFLRCGGIGGCLMLQRLQRRHPTRPTSTRLSGGAIAKTIQRYTGCLFRSP